MRRRAVDACPVCGGSGPLLHQGLRDRVFQVPGSWDMRRCTGCGCLWLDPRPVDADLHLAYASYFTHQGQAPPRRGGAGPALSRAVRVLRDVGTDDYIARRFGYRPPQPWWSRPASLLVRPWPGRRLDAEFKVLRLRGIEGGRLLDVGCGDGTTLAALQARGWEVQGIDFDAEGAAAARRRGLAVDVGDLTERGYPARSFDVVSLNHSLEHLADPRLTLLEVRRILRPGGRIVILTPNATSWLSRRYGADWQGLEPPRHLQIFTRPALSRLVADAGFSGIDAVTTARSANGVARTAWKLRRDGRWDMESRPSLAERVPMELIQQWEAWKVMRDPDAGEEIALTATNDASPPERTPEGEPGLLPPEKRARIASAHPGPATEVGRFRAL
ncbi:MAG: class I SAM-dependent methyltransferase [Acidimicrobiales bacterium]